jgi:hypothetical protein
MMTLVLASLVLLVLAGVGTYLVLGYVHSLGTRDRRLEELENERRNINKQILSNYALMNGLQAKNDPNADRVQVVIDILETESKELTRKIVNRKVEVAERQALDE